MASKLTPSIVLNNRVRASAYSLLAALRHPVDEPIETVATDPIHRVEVRITNLTAAGAEELPGNYFSPIERCVYDAAVKADLARPGEPIKAATIARISSQTLDTKLKFILSNLVDRGVLVRRSKGYGLARPANATE